MRNNVLLSIWIVQIRFSSLDILVPPRLAAQMNVQITTISKPNCDFKRPALVTTVTIQGKKKKK